MAVPVVPRVSSRLVPALIRAHTPFNLNASIYPNLYARWVYPGPDETSRIYVVFSYGTHFPIYAYDPAIDCWYGNADKYSRTTSRHQSLCRPPQVNCWLKTDDMRRTVVYGFMGMMVRKAGGQA